MPASTSPAMRPSVRADSSRISGRPPFSSRLNSTNGITKRNSPFVCNRNDTLT